MNAGEIQKKKANISNALTNSEPRVEIMHVGVGPKICSVFFEPSR